MPRGRKGTNLHPGQPCGPCHLCQERSTHYSHLATWRENLKERVNQFTLTVERDCVCRKCEKDIKRNISKDAYTPRWVRSGTRAAQCIVLGCTHTGTIIRSGSITSHQVSQVLNVEVRQDSSRLVNLCGLHYRSAYDQNRGERKGQKCYTCHSTRQGMMRHCPDPGVINTHYMENGDIDLNITNSDYVCTSCYNTHLDIVHRRQSISRDDDLKEILADIN